MINGPDGEASQAIRLAFFWVGEKIAVPQFLVDSARLVSGDGLQIVQLTDFDTPAVTGVTSVLRQKLPKAIMVARLLAYKACEAEGVPTFYCDADSLLINPLQVDFGSYDILVSPREIDFVLNDRYPEYYPEFSGRRACQVMPYLFGAIALKAVGLNFFAQLHDICMRLPERFHRWYGDQVSLKLALQHGRVDFGHLQLSRHLNVLRSNPGTNELSRLRSSGVQMVTFKGLQSKQYIEAVYADLRSVLGHS